MSNELLHRWKRVKEDIAHLQSQEERIKDALHRIMNERGVNMLSSEDYTCTRRVRHRETLRRKDVPSNVWTSYVRRTEYPVLTLTKK